MKVDYKRSDLPVFVDKVKELVDDQVKEFEAAVVNRGKFKLREQYRFLEVLEHEWYRKSLGARQAQLKKFHKTVVDIPVGAPVATSLSLSASTSVANVPSLSASVSDIVAGSSVPISVFEGIWSKALQLTRADGAMATAPGHASEA